MSISRKNTKELAGAMEITKYPNSPLIKSREGRSVLVVYDGNDEYILGYITKADTINPLLVYSQYFSGSYGHVLNDVYNNVQSVSEVNSTHSLKNRTVLVGNSNFIGKSFHTIDDLDTQKRGFNDVRSFWTDQYNFFIPDVETPLSPNYNDEAHFTLLEGGNKLYQSSSGTLQEANSIRINIGASGTDIHSWGDWTPSSLRVETPIDRSLRSMAGIAYASGARSGTGFGIDKSYHIYNFVDNSSFFMGNSIIEIEKANVDNTVYAKTVYDANGVTISTDSGSKVTLSVDGSPPTTLVIEDGVVTITTPSMSYDGNVIITGTLQVEGKTTLDTELDVGAGKVIVDGAGKLTTIGGNALG